MQPADAARAENAVVAHDAVDRDLTIRHVAELKPRLQAWLDAGGASLSLALAQECDGAGLQLLASLRRACRARGRDLVLTGIQPNALEAMRRTGFDVTFAA